ncbi:hypothetical protein [Sphingopyxis sp. BSNA05]|uniref:hypothetical protein n=1 Tax=Sphingopyxis sp. BSNA05 TaxID=1236614 RepID=UPI0015668306|nr:hypothetical protein [Sphingopyxis sp. BSNA05]
MPGIYTAHPCHAALLWNAGTELVKRMLDYSVGPRKKEAVKSGCAEEAGQQRVGLFVNLREMDQFRLFIYFLLGVRLALFIDIHFAPFNIYRPDVIRYALRDSHARSGKF